VETLRGTRLWTGVEALPNANLEVKGKAKSRSQVSRFFSPAFERPVFEIRTSLMNCIQGKIVFMFIYEMLNTYVTDRR
jgi:hypothetical protein